MGLYRSLARGLHTNASKGGKVASADTITAHGKLMVTIPGGLAEFERQPDPIADSGREATSFSLLLNIKPGTEARIDNSFGLRNNFFSTTFLKIGGAIFQCTGRAR